MLVDDSASATVRQLGDALTELEVNGHFFGQTSLTLVLHGTDGRALQQQAAEAMKAMAVHDGSLFDETYNLLNAWLEHRPRQRRPQPASTGAARDEPRGPELPVHAGPRARPSARTLDAKPWRCSRRRTTRRTRSTCTFRTSDTRSCSARPGSGKSFLLNFLVTHAQKYSPQTVVLDLGPQLSEARHAAGRAATWRSGCRQGDVSINPFCPRANAGEPPLPARLRPRAPGGRRPVSDQRPRGPGDLRGGREPVRPRPRASVGSSRWPTCCPARWPGVCTNGLARGATRASSTTSRTR